MKRWAFAQCLTPGPTDALAEALMALSSAVLLASDGVWLEIGSSIALFGDEPTIAQQARELATILERPINLAIADHPYTARILALASSRPVTLVPPGGDADALAPLPLSALQASPRARAYLARLGIETVAELARLEPPALRRRLGEEGEALTRLARAEELPLPRRFTPPEQPVATRELEPPIPPSEAVLFLVKALLDELTTRLAGRGLALVELCLSFDFEGGATRSETLLLPRPLRSTAPLLALLQERLFGIHDAEADRESRDWPARISALSLRALRTTEAPRAQLSLLGRDELDEEELTTLLARLSSTIGSDNVFSAELVPTHRPEEAWQRRDFAPTTTRRRPSSSRPARSLRATKDRTLHEHEHEEPPAPRPTLLLPEPLPLQGELCVGADLSWDGGDGRVCALWGPERLRGHWWRTPFDRDYYVLDLEDGARLWIFWDRRDEAFYLHGVFD